jgi:hypothetical protein
VILLEYLHLQLERRKSKWVFLILVHQSRQHLLVPIFSLSQGNTTLSRDVDEMYIRHKVVLVAVDNYLKSKSAP